VTERVCAQCHKPGTDTGDSELRPYGPGGTLICYGCAHATPEMEQIVERNLAAQFEAAAAASPDGIVVLGLGTPEPFVRDDPA